MHACPERLWRRQQQSLAFMMTDSGAPVLLTDRRHAPEAMAPGVRVVLLDADWPTIARESERAWARNACSQRELVSES
jgi:hypothetical protein